MPYNSLIDRSGAEALMPEEASREILGHVPERNPFWSLATQLPMMSRAQRRIPVVNTLPVAYFVAPRDTGLKQTTKMDWTDKYVDAEEIACIAPIPEAVLDDADYDIWGQIRPHIAEAISVAALNAIFRGTGAPASWPTDIVTQATNAGHVVYWGDFADGYDAILSEGGVLSLMENDGFMASGHLAAPQMKAKLRGVRDADGMPIFRSSMTEKGVYELDGEACHFPRDGSIDGSSELMISGDWRHLVYALRQDITYKLLDQAVIQDSDGNIIYNLAQQDMVALRVVFRMGWQLPNPKNRLNQNDSTRLPFAILKDGVTP